MHKGIKPAAQPRSLRSVAETNSGKLFPPVASEEDNATKHTDVAEQARPTTVGQQPAGPNPFGSLSGK